MEDGPRFKGYTGTVSRFTRDSHAGAGGVRGIGVCLRLLPADTILTQAHKFVFVDELV